MIRKKKVLFVINTISKAGAEVSLLAMLKALDPSKYDIDLFVLVNEGELFCEVPANVRILNRGYCEESVLDEKGKSYLKKYTALSALSRFSVIKNLPYMVKNFNIMRKRGNIRADRLLWRMISDGAPRGKRIYDLAVAYLEGGSTYYVADHVEALHKIAFVHVDYTRAGYTRALDLDSYDAFEKIYTVSEDVRRTFLTVYPEYDSKTFVMSNMIDQQGIRQKIEEGTGFTDEFDGLRILTVSRLHPQKGVDMAVKAAEYLKRDGLKFRWYVLGDGQDRDILKEEIRARNLEDVFRIEGAADNPYPFMAQCDIYVQPSRFEGKSVAIEEALTAGAFVIATDVSGSKEQINDGETGVLCQPSPEGIYKAVSRAAEDEELRKKCSKAASEIIYDNSKQINVLTDILKD